MQRIHLQDCLHWCDDIAHERRMSRARGCREVLWIDHDELGVFACQRDGQLCVFVRNGSKLPALETALRQTA